MDCVTISTVLVDQSGKGNFKTIQGAIDSIKQNNDQWVKIHINAGKYSEKVVIPPEKPWIFLEGDGKDVTTITFNDHHEDKGEWNATFTSKASNVIASGITFENTYNLAGQMGAGEHQALAATIDGGKCAFHKCGFVGFQDTLFDSSGIHYFKECYIQGEVDFIFGYAQSFYEDCIINATPGSSRLGPGYVTAHGRKTADTTGFVFKGGRVEGTGQVNLGRAWEPFSRVIFFQTFFGSLITPQGWFAWNAQGQEQNTFYAEVNCTGPGSDTTQRVKWEKKLSTEDMNRKYSITSFINPDGWLQKLPSCFLSDTAIQVNEPRLQPNL